MFELKILTHFAAAHQLKMVAEKCENLHGHNWNIEVCIQGKSLNEAGVLIDFGELKTHINEIIAGLDHKFLNDLTCFADGNPSSENIAFYIANALQEQLKTVPDIDPNLKVKSVSAWETKAACATYLTD